MQQVRKSLTDLFNSCVFHRVESMVTRSAVEESTQTISSQVSQAWHAFEINLISQGTSAAWRGFGLVVMGTEKRFLQHYVQCSASKIGCGPRRQ